MSELLADLPSDLKERLRPSNMEEYLTCPLLSAFKRGWVPRAVQWTPNLTLGSAVHAGLKVLLGYVGDEDDAYAEVKRVMAEGYVPQEYWELEKLQKLACRGLDKALGALSLLARERRVVERKLYLGTPDLITETVLAQSLTITDTKCHLTPHGWTDDYATSLQQWAYVEEVSRYWDAPVEWYRILQVTFTPKVEAELVPFRVTPRARAFWRTILRDVSERIIQEYKGEAYRFTLAEEGPDTRPTVGNPASCHRYGRCVAFEACHEFQWDVSRMATLYTPRVKEATPSVQDPVR